VSRAGRVTLVTYDCQILMPSDDNEKRFAFEAVLKAERKEIDEARNARDAALDEAGTPRGIEALRSQFVGLAFSGGGIRSATFNLGVLQGLAELGLLPIIDYLSTVSGGGYIGTWLTAWIKREKFPTVIEALKTARPSGDGIHDPHQHSKQEPLTIRRLREYSNYLTPKLGLVSGDTWAFVGAYLRNLTLNQLILGLVLLALLLLPRPFIPYFRMIAGGTPSVWNVPLLVAIVLLGVALGTTLANLSKQAQDSRGKKDIESVLASSGWILGLVVIPTLVGLWLMWAWLWSVYPSWKIQGMAWSVGFGAGLGFMGLWFAGWLGGECVRRFFAVPAEEARKNENQDKKESESDVAGTGRLKGFITNLAERAGVLKIIGWAGPAGLVGGLLYARLTQFMLAHMDKGSDRIEIYGFPLVVAVFLFMQTLHIGLAGREFTEDAREWWGRLSGALMLSTLYVTALFAISLDGPKLIPWLVREHYSWVRWLLGAVWAGITGGGLIAGKATAKPNASTGIGRTIIVKIAPYVFIIGLLLLLSTFADRTFSNLGNFGQNFPTAWSTKAHTFVETLPAWAQALAADLRQMGRACESSVWFYIVLFFALATFLSRREGINRFSMHSLYRNRLVRCYLGASNPNRQPQPFIGMDPNDDSVMFTDLLHTAEEPYQGPYPIYNTALNMVSGDDLAWQQRKAASFVFTPNYSGFEFTDTKGQKICGLQDTKPLENKLKLGLAMAISGAAASPNMGSHSTPALAFLLTVFNVRLGWWLGNPYKPAIWKEARMGPHWGLFYLFNELMGNTDYNRDFVYLSDGGHFENLALYELVRRQCRFIIVCDAGEDHLMHFEDLGNAIEKCRTDFGVDIEIDVEEIRRQADSNNSKWHCAVGTIHYEKVNGGVPAGTLLYLKSSMTGDEPTDVQRYASEHAEFPHETTADQWFTESQFESYRALGHHVVEASIGVLGDEKEIQALGVEGLFVKLRQKWYPPSRFVAQSFTKHTATYTSLLEKLRKDKTLEFLDSQVYPEWPNLMERPNQAKRAGIWLPDDPAERRAGFYFCNEVIQLMEDAYIDLNLEEDFDHPDNRGWMNLFRHWSWSGMFKATWAISAGIYGARFQSFCGRRLDLNVGTVELGEPTPLWQQGEPATEKLKPSLDAQKRWNVDFWEAELISKFVDRLQTLAAQRAAGDQNRDATSPNGEMFVRPFHVIVKSPRQEDRQELRFNVGYALLEMKNADAKASNIVYFRIQDHLRKMGLGREALSKLVDDYGFGLTNKVRAVPRPENQADDLSLGASVLEAYPSPEAEMNFRNLFASARMRTHPGPKIHVKRSFEAERRGRKSGGAD
jgi:predicted acylesterase/phospholipase RssA